MSNNNSPLVISIIVHYQSPDECLQLIDDLQKITCPNHQIVIVDNQSDPTIFEYLKTNISFTNTELIQNHSNNGYGAGINFGVNHIKHLNPGYYHIINTDTRISNTDYISQLVMALSANKKAGFIGPAVSMPGGEIQNTILPFFSFQNALFFKRKHGKNSFIEDNPQFYPVDVINGVCALIRAEAFDAIKGFDEDFFMYGEEHDFCYRLKKAGYPSFFLSSPSIIHYEKHNKKIGKKVSWRDVLVRSNQILFLKKHNKSISAVGLSLLFSLTFFIKFLSGYSFEPIKLKRSISALFFPKRLNKKLPFLLASKK